MCYNLEKYIYRTDTVVGTYNCIQGPSKCHNIQWDRQINAKNGLSLKFRKKIVCIGQHSIKAIHIESFYYSSSNWLRLDKDDG